MRTDRRWASQHRLAARRPGLANQRAHRAAFPIANWGRCGSQKSGTGPARSNRVVPLRHAGDQRMPVLAARFRRGTARQGEFPTFFELPFAVESAPSVRITTSTPGLPSPPCPRRADAYPSQSSDATVEHVTRARSEAHVLTPSDSPSKGKPRSQCGVSTASRSSD